MMKWNGSEIFGFYNGFILFEFYLFKKFKQLDFSVESTRNVVKMIKNFPLSTNSRQTVLRNSSL